MVTKDTTCGVKPGTDIIEYNGVEYTGTDAIGKLCRDLVAQGYEYLGVYRGDQLSLTVDVPKRAKKSLVEDKKKGFRFVVYTPFEMIKGEGC